MWWVDVQWKNGCTDLHGPYGIICAIILLLKIKHRYFNVANVKLRKENADAR